MLHSERFAGLHMHSGCIHLFTDSIRKLTKMDPFSIPFIAREFSGFTADEVRNA